MNPSFNDFEYQASLAERGAYLEYDMIGMDYFYAQAGNAQSPSDEENAKAIKELINAGYINKILLSQDVFLKMMLTRFGGFGYAHILRHFVPPDNPILRRQPRKDRRERGNQALYFRMGLLQLFLGHLALSHVPRVGQVNCISTKGGLGGGSFNPDGLTILSYAFPFISGWHTFAFLPSHDDPGHPFTII